ncbi:MAG: nitrous oxide reductase family maturation protein NosD [Phycisphaerae bacterium]
MAPCATSAFTADVTEPVGEPVLEPPTLYSLGVYWIIHGDEGKSARVEVEYRAVRQSQTRTAAASSRPGDHAPSNPDPWKRGANLFRVEKLSRQLAKHESSIEVPSGAWLFAGSLVMLEPDTEYELRLRLVAPEDRGAVKAVEKTLKARTLAEPAIPADAPRYHVVPGSGGGKGTAVAPYEGLAEAQASAKPGDVFLVHKGTYTGPFNVTTSGRAGKPIVWMAAGDGEALIDGRDRTNGIEAREVSDVWFEGLTIRNAKIGLVANESANVVIRRCCFEGCPSAIWCTTNKSGKVKGFLISDNVLEGTHKWTEEKGANVAEDRGIQITGIGHVICYNRVRGFKDGIDTFPSRECSAIDIHNNDVSECLDDGCEMDYSERNTRNFCNRYTNVFQGVSVQPVYGGPVYVFRNVLYNVCVEPFKMHNSPSGAIFYHNTVVKAGEPLLLWTTAPVHNCVYRNNLFIGTSGSCAYDCSPQMVDCDFDYDGFGGGPWTNFLNWNKATYRTLNEAKARSGIYRHAVLVDPEMVFASGIKPPSSSKEQFDPGKIDLRLKEGCGAIDKGEVLPGFNDGYAGKAPDLGACELGTELPHYGPRLQKK